MKNASQIDVQVYTDNEKDIFKALLNSTRGLNVTDDEITITKILQNNPFDNGVIFARKNDWKNCTSEIRKLFKSCYLRKNDNDTFGYESDLKLAYEENIKIYSIDFIKTNIDKSGFIDTINLYNDAIYYGGLECGIPFIDLQSESYSLEKYMKLLPNCCKVAWSLGDWEKLDSLIGMK